MGVVHVLHELDPAAVAKVVKKLGGGAEVGADEAREFLIELGKSPQDAELDSWDELEEIAALPSAHLRNHVLLAASSVQMWDLDKALDRPAGGFLALFARERSLRPVRDLLTGRMRDGLPAEFYMGEGLIAVVRAKELAEVERALDPFSGDGARSRIAELKAGPLARLFGGARFAQAWAEDDYLWTYWQNLVDAVRTTSAREGWLGVVTG